MKRFIVIWLSQLLSIGGSRMTSFALAVWAWQQTGQATALALVVFFAFLPEVLLSPLAGVLIDKWNRRALLIVADAAAGVGTLAIALLFWSGNLEVWHLFLVAAWSGAFQALQAPTFMTVVTTLVPEEQFARANALRSLATSFSSIMAPVAAALLLSAGNLATVLMVDLAACALAIATLAWIRVPQPEPGDVVNTDSVFRQMAFGFVYLLQRRSLLSLLLIFAFFNFVIAFGITVLSPMVLARTGDSAVALGTVQSALGLGGVVGGVFISLWGGPKRRITGIAAGLAGGALSIAGMGLVQGVYAWAIVAFAVMFFLPMVDAFFGAIFQSAVSPDVQGRVFASSRVVAHLATPLGMGLAGPLADYIFEPLAAKGGLPTWLVSWVGTGAGSGMSLMLLLAGVTAGALVILIRTTSAWFVERSAIRSIPDVSAQLAD